MSADKDDLAYVWDCWNAVRKANRYTDGIALADYEGNELLRLGVERLLLIAGEAAGRVSETYRRDNAGAPWQELIRMRNLIAHSYEPEVVTRVWGSIRRVLPQAELQLECLLPWNLRSKEVD